jgi:hypothetical protein
VNSYSSGSYVRYKHVPFRKRQKIHLRHLYVVNIIEVSSCATLAAVYGLDWYKNRKQNRRLARKIEEEDQIAKEPLTGQLA